MLYALAAALYVSCGLVGMYIADTSGWRPRRQALTISFWLWPLVFLRTAFYAPAHFYRWLDSSDPHLEMTEKYWREKEAWEEKCRGFMNRRPGGSKPKKPTKLPTTTGTPEPPPNREVIEGSAKDGTFLYDPPFNRNKNP